MCQELEKIYCEGYAEGYAEGHMEQFTEGIVSSIKNLVDTLGLSIEGAMSALRIPENEQDTYVNLLDKL